MDIIIIGIAVAWYVRASSPKARAKRRAKFYKRCFPGHWR
jgi:hypothetical protein